MCLEKSVLFLKIQILGVLRLVDSDTIRSPNPLSSSSGPSNDPSDIPIDLANDEPEESSENQLSNDDVMNVTSDEPVNATPPPGRRQRRAPKRLGDWVY